MRPIQSHEMITFDLPSRAWGEKFIPHVEEYPICLTNGACKFPEGYSLNHSKDFKKVFKRFCMAWNMTAKLIREAEVRIVLLKTDRRDSLPVKGELARPTVDASPTESDDSGFV